MHFSPRRTGLCLLLGGALLFSARSAGAQETVVPARASSQPVAGKGGQGKDAGPADHAKATSTSQPGGSVLRLNLADLLSRARQSYPGIRAAQYAVEAMEGRLFQARYAMMPQGRISGLLAPSPTVECLDANGIRSEDSCVRTTNPNISSFSFAGIFARLDAELGMPLWTFNKIGSAQKAARAGVAAEQARKAATTADLELKVVSAYWGLKLAREIRYVVGEGRKKLADETKRVEQQLEKDEGEVTTTDLKRLQTFGAIVDNRVLEAEKLALLAKAALARLVGLAADRFDVDNAIIALQDGTLKPLADYLQLARLGRPEVQALRAAVRAHRALSSLEVAQFFPDLLLVATATAAVATGVDDPKNAFYNDPFNVLGAGIGLVMRWRIDPVGQIGKYRQQSAAAKRIEAQKQEALVGIDLEIEKSVIELRDAKARLATTARGRGHARSWLAAITQNLAAGIGSPKDLTDVLPTYFELQLKYLQAVFDINIGWARLGRAIGRAQEQLASLRK